MAKRWTRKHIGSEDHILVESIKLDGLLQVEADPIFQAAPIIDEVKDLLREDAWVKRPYDRYEDHIKLAEAWSYRRETPYGWQPCGLVILTKDFPGDERTLRRRGIPESLVAETKYRRGRVKGLIISETPQRVVAEYYMFRTYALTAKGVATAHGRDRSRGEALLHQLLSGKYVSKHRLPDPPPEPMSDEDAAALNF